MKRKDLRIVTMQPDATYADCLKHDLFVTFDLKGYTVGYFLIYNDIGANGWAIALPNGHMVTTGFGTCREVVGMAKAFSREVDDKKLSIISEMKHEPLVSGVADFASSRELCEAMEYLKRVRWSGKWDGDF